MTVLAIEVEVNGKRLVLAGANDLSLLTAYVGAGVGPKGGTLSVNSEVLLSVMGVALAPPRPKNLTWINGRKLRLGDSVTFRIVSVDEADRPTQVFGTPTSEELAAAAEQEQRGLTAPSRPTRNLIR